MALKGAPELRRRLKAIRQAFKPIGRDWADDTARRAKLYAPSRTGKLQRSIRRKNASMRKASVAAIYYGHMVAEGAKQHVIKPRHMKAVKFDVGGRTVFSKRVQHPGIRRKNPYARRAASEALADRDLLMGLLELWNRAA